MKILIPAKLLLFTLALVVLSCSTMTKNHYEQQVKNYILQFEKNLSASDQVILAQFQTDKADKVILKAVQIMQNKELSKDSIKCVINFKQTTITFEDVAVRVDLMAQHQSIDDRNPLQKQTRITLWLSYDDDANLYISKMDAEDFYSEHRSLVYELRNIRKKEKDIASRDIYFEKAKLIEGRYDTIIWYTKYQDSIYFYVVNGNWSNYFLDRDGVKSESYVMGLVSETGREVIPPAYDLVGTIGFEIPGVVEVKKDGLVGHYTLDGSETVPSEFEIIIPFMQDSIYALTKRDTIYGWIATDFSFHDTPPSSEALKYIKEFGYLDKRITLDINTTLTEILDIKNMGFGIVIPSTHYIKARVFPEIVSDIFTGFNSLGWGGTAALRTEGSLFTNITNKISALLLSLQKEYVEGREGFYNSTQLTFVDYKSHHIQSYTLEMGQTILNRIDSTLLEVRNQRLTFPEEEYYLEGVETEYNAPNFKYFKLTESNVTELTSNRFYNFTEYVKLDSSYFSGEFSYWDYTTNESAVRNFLSDVTLKLIRNEILATYGFVFKDPKDHMPFEHKKWYEARYKSYSEFLDQMTDIDKHNLLFLETLVGTLDNPSAV